MLYRKHLEEHIKWNKFYEKKLNNHKKMCDDYLENKIATRWSVILWFFCFCSRHSVGCLKCMYTYFYRNALEEISILFLLIRLFILHILESFKFLKIMYICWVKIIFLFYRFKFINMGEKNVLLFFCVFFFSTIFIVCGLIYCF